MKKFLFFLLWPFNRLYDLFYEICDDYEKSRLKLVDSHKVVYLVVAYPYNKDDEIVICSACDDFEKAESFCDDVLEFSDHYRKVEVEAYTMNCLEAW